MRYPAAEKAEIIQLVEQSHMPAKRTLDTLGIPNGQLDLHLQRVPDLPVSLRPGLGLRETLLGLPPMLGIGGGDPCSALLGPWTGRPPSMQPAPACPHDSGPLTFCAAPGLRKAPFARPFRPETGGEADGREPRHIVFHGAVGSAVLRVV